MKLRRVTRQMFVEDDTVFEHILSSIKSCGKDPDTLQKNWRPGGPIVYPENFRWNRTGKPEAISMMHTPSLGTRRFGTPVNQHVVRRIRSIMSQNRTGSLNILGEPALHRRTGPSNKTPRRSKFEQCLRTNLNKHPGWKSTHRE